MRRLLFAAFPGAGPSHTGGGKCVGNCLTRNIQSKLQDMALERLEAPNRATAQRRVIQDENGKFRIERTITFPFEFEIRDREMQNRFLLICQLEDERRGMQL